MTCNAILTILAFALFTPNVISGESVDLKDSLKNYGNSMNPSQLKLNMKMNSDQIELNLTRNSNSDSLTLVVLGQNGTLAPWSEQRFGDYSVYQDRNLLASILVLPERSANGDIVREYQGTFKYKDEYYRLHRDASKRRRRRRSGGDQYVVTKIDPTTLGYRPERLPNVNLPYAGELLSFAGGDVSNYIVEVLVVLDYSVYKTWYDLSKKTTDADKRIDAINGIRYYYAQIINGVDLRYSTIVENDFSIRVRLAGYFIAMTPTDSVWTESNGIRQVIDQTVYSDAYKALDSLETWINATARDLPTFDQATLFTSNVLMAGTYTNGSPRSISGLADIQGICSRGKASVNKEGGEYSSTETAAHEMGHNLGAQHDGTTNTCDGSKQFIMSSAPAQLTADNFLNPYRFSQCSIDYFRRFLGTLKMMNANCLLQTSTNMDPGQVDKNSQIPPGQFINIDQQCQHLYGINSYYCGGDDNDKKMCYEMWCYSPSDRRCTTRTEQRAANGTTCGNRKWCSMGRCIDSASAPVASDFCLSGDYRGDVIDCRSEVAVNPGRCYEAWFNKTCCASCQAIRDKNTDSCPYGDVDKTYCKNSVRAPHCYDARIKQQCCSTCKQYETSVPDCTYGDKADWCASNDNSICYSNPDVCCSTCYYRYIGYSDCPYGDKASWCQGLPKSQCADRSTASLCCVACDPKKTSVTTRPRPTTLAPPAGGGSGSKPNDPNCRDTATWCSTMPASYCYSAQKLCCRTCNSYFTGRLGCEYGNRFPWCSTISMSNCKFLEDQSDCCQRCPTGLLTDGPYSSNSTNSSVLPPEILIVRFDQKSQAIHWSSSLTTSSYIVSLLCLQYALNAYFRLSSTNYRC